MAKLEDLGEIISTDVLIVGGGIAGLIAAIKAKEASPEADVLVVDRETIGWSGKAPKGAGVLWVLTPEYDLDKFVEYHVKNIGIYLEDQDLVYSYASETYRGVEQLAEWGAKVVRDADGKIDVMRSPIGLWALAAVDLDMLLKFRARARKLGAKTLNKVDVVELLKQDDRVVGAVGFNVIDGRFYIFKAKAIILATSSCNYRLRRMWAAGSGDGIAAAYRAGAEMRSAEFGNSCVDVIVKHTGEGDTNRSYIFNALGENISEKYEPGVEPDLSVSLALGMEKEVREGRGPLYDDRSKIPPEIAGLFAANMTRWDQHRPQASKHWGRLMSKMAKYGSLPSIKREVTLLAHAELSPIKVDHEMKTTLDGLWAIGDTSWGGSGWTGAVAPPGRIRGSGLMNAYLSAIRGGPSAASFTAEAAPPEVDYAEVKQLKEDILAPMGRDKGLLPADAIRAIQEVIAPVKYTIYRSKDRLEEALSKIKEVQQRIPELWAKDGHGLCRCNQVKSMAVCAEMSFRAALMRTESRGWHVREDYPERDDKNWLKWIIVKKEDGKMVLSTEPVPIDKYKFKP